MAIKVATIPGSNPPRPYSWCMSAYLMEGNGWDGGFLQELYNAQQALITYTNTSTDVVHLTGAKLLVGVGAAGSRFRSDVVATGEPLQLRIGVGYGTYQTPTSDIVSISPFTLVSQQITGAPGGAGAGGLNSNIRTEGVPIDFTFDTVDVAPNQSVWINIVDSEPRDSSNVFCFGFLTTDEEEDILPVIYRLRYNANGGTGTPPSTQVVTDGTRVTVQSGSALSKATTTVSAEVNLDYQSSIGVITRTVSASVDHKFDRWTKGTDSSSVTVPVGTSLILHEDVTLYAQYTDEPPQYHSLKITDPTKSGSIFQGWFTSATGGTRVGRYYHDAESGNDVCEYTPEALSTTLYAQWSTLIGLYYNANGGSGAPPAVLQESGTTFYLNSTDPEPTRASADSSFVVRFNANGGVNYDSSSVVTNNLTKRRSYTFAYYTGSAVADASDIRYKKPPTDYVSSLVLTANKTLYAQYTVTDTYPTIQRISNPTRTGYNFKGWSTSSTGDSFVTFPYTPTSGSSVTFYAIWAKVVTLTYSANGGVASSVPSPQSAETGSTFTVSATEPTRNNSTANVTILLNYQFSTETTTTRTSVKTSSYSFAYWTDYSSGQGDNRYKHTGDGYIHTLTLTSNKTVYAQYYKTVSYSSVELPTPTRAGYTFRGWDTAQSGTGVRYQSTYTPTDTSSRELYAIWTPTITYKVNTELGKSSHWSSDAPPGVANTTNDYVQAISESATHVTLITKSPVTDAESGSVITITYQLNGGSSSSLPQPAPTTVEYTFTYWYDRDGDTAGASKIHYDKGETIPVPTEPLILWAQYRGSSTYTSVTLPTPTKSVRLTYNTNTTEGSDTATVVPAYKTIAIPFVSWKYTKSDESTETFVGGSTITPTQNMTLVAQWGSATVGQLPVYTQDSSVTPRIYRSNFNNHIFRGWLAQPSDDTYIDDTYSISSDTTIYARWAFTLTFHNQLSGGVTTSPETYEVTIREGYGYTLDYIPVKQIRLSYDPRSSSESSAKVYIVGGVGPDSTSGISYVDKSLNLQGWSDTSSSTTIQYQTGDSILLTSNKDIYAVWGSVSIGTLPVYQSSTPSTPVTRSVIVRTVNASDYRLHSSNPWTTTSGGSTSVNANTQINKNTTIYAKWAFRVHAYANGGYYSYILRTSSITRDSSGRTRTSDAFATSEVFWADETSTTKLSDVMRAFYNIPASTTDSQIVELERLGHTATGYATTSTADTATFGTDPSFTSIVKPISLYAVWVKKKYSVTFYDGFRTPPNDFIKTVSNIPFGDSVPANEVPRLGETYGGKKFSRPGPYALVGWSGSYTNVTADTSCTALWDFCPIWIAVDSVVGNTTVRKWVKYQPSED